MPPECPSEILHFSTYSWQEERKIARLTSHTRNQVSNFLEPGLNTPFSCMPLAPSRFRYNPKTSGLLTWLTPTGCRPLRTDRR